MKADAGAGVKGLCEPASGLTGWRNVSTLPADATDDIAASSLDVRPPLQRRSREAWQRVLDAGVELLEEGGYPAFTIAAVCDRAQVAPRALYTRVDTKDALFLAVYEHGIARVRADHTPLIDEKRFGVGLVLGQAVDRERWAGGSGNVRSARPVAARGGADLRRAP